MIIHSQIPSDERRFPEAEIIPPDRHDYRKRKADGWSRVVIEHNGAGRVYVGRIGPLGLIPFALLGGFISVGLLVFFLGAFLILAPLLGLIVAGTILSGLMRPSRH
jgi:hypothetical protein